MARAVLSPVGVPAGRANVPIVTTAGETVFPQIPRLAQQPRGVPRSSRRGEAWWEASLCRREEWREGAAFGWMVGPCAVPT